MTDDDLASLYALHGLSAPAPKVDPEPSAIRRGMTAREVRALFASHDLPAPARGVVAAAVKASALAAAAPAMRRKLQPRPARPAHRPIKSHSVALDAACLYRELRRRGLKCREATTALHDIFGTARSQILKYQHHVVEPANVEHDRKCAEFVVALYWVEKPMIRRNWWELTPKAREALLPIVEHRLMGAYPPRLIRTKTTENALEDHSTATRGDPDEQGFSSRAQRL